jgi:hypothetical protein
MFLIILVVIVALVMIVALHSRDEAVSRARSLGLIRG